MRPYKKRVIISQAQLHNENGMETDNSEDSDAQVSCTNVLNGWLKIQINLPGQPLTFYTKRQK